jgi:ParB family transcriptional regulator, chromosome partitioning protein
MSDSIESMRRSSIEVIDLPTADIEPDPMNPNTVAEALMDALRADIVERGFVQPVLVRPFGGKYRIIDGEHRWRVLAEAEAETVPCVIDDAGEDDARIRMLTMNALRGQFVPVKLAAVLVKLAEAMDEEELRKRLGMDEEEYADTVGVGEAGRDVDERLAAALVAESQAAPEILSWRLPTEVAEAFEEQVEARDAVRAAALIEILEEQDERSD